MVRKIGEAEFEAARGDAAAVVDFSAGWCGPCRMLAPVIEEISEEMAGVNFYNVDVDECPALAREFGIVSIPFVAVLKGGSLAASSAGFLPKDAMKDFIEKSV